jgi:hypothetical protein
MERETRALNSWQGLPETRISSVEFMISLTGTFSSVGITEILSVQFMDALKFNFQIDKSKRSGRFNKTVCLCCRNMQDR